MQDLEDMELLRQYTDNNSEDAFATLTARHISKIYSVALRHTRNPHQAEEITQAVFVILIRKARGLRKNSVLSSWLYQTARWTSVTYLRTEIRRAKREKEAHMQTLLDQSEPAPWDQISPLLDSAIASLSGKDRTAIVLRFFDGKSMKEVGEALATNEDAAKKRVNRAVEKLRHFFTRRGLVWPAAGLTAAISANAVQAASPQLASSVVTLAAAQAASVSTLALASATLKALFWAKLKSSLAIGGPVLVAGAAVASAVLLDQSRPLVPVQILNHVQARYASISNYSETMKTTIATALSGRSGGSGGQVADAMTLKLGRPKLYRAEEVTGAPYATWSVGDGNFWMLFQNQFYRTNDERQGSELLFLAPTGIIPCAFFGRTTENALKSLAATPDLAKQPDELIAGVPCYTLSGSPHLTFPKNMKLTLWIGKQDLLIRQVKAMMVINARIPYTNTVIQTHENILVNRPLSKNDFIHPIPPSVKPFDTFPGFGNSQ
jgi:RNA polymerase sigma factor (sigma-70 family)